MNAAALAPPDLHQVLRGEQVLQMRSASAAETRDLAAQLARLLTAGECVLLFGDLGAGKTTFVKGFCEAWGVREKITSPTFTIMHSYAGARLAIYHFDFYRLRTVQEIAALGVEEYFAGEGICLIEWPEPALPLLPPRALCVQLALPDYRAHPDLRLIEIARRAV